MIPLTGAMLTIERLELVRLSTRPAAPTIIAA
jgi:hypothetical protein